MNILLKKFGLVSIVILVIFAVVLIYLLKGPNDEEVERNLRHTTSSVIGFEKALRGKPVESWWDFFYASTDYSDLWIEIASINEFSGPTEALLRKNETDSGVDEFGTAYAQRLVVGTDQIVTLNFDDSSAAETWSIPAHIVYLTAGVLIGLIGLFWLIVISPLSRQYARLEDTARGFASGNFALRVPASDSHSDHDIGDRLNEMAAQIETLITQNETLIDDQREMLRAVAHEFRGPLARMRFALDMTEDADVSQSSDLLHQMGNDLDELDLLVGEVLSYARLQPGAPSLVFGRVDFDELIDDTVSESRLNFPEITIEQTGRGYGKSAIEVDAYYMQRAILNLVNNAARHAESKVQVTWTVDDTHCFVHVDDDGDGVPPNWQNRVFEPFVRIDPSRSRHSGGVGLGLAIVKRVADNHKGKASVSKAEELGGARFSLTWPLALSQQDSANAS